jgi:hypothetical protein
MNDTKSLADALRRRARWLDGKTTSHMESGWGDKGSVIAALYEFADVVDSWSGEYLSKEEAENEYMRRRWGENSDPMARPLTMEERIAAVKKFDSIQDL